MLGVVAAEVLGVLSVEESHDRSTVSGEDEYVQQLATTHRCGDVCVSCTIRKTREVN